MKIISLDDYITKYHSNIQAAAANHLITASTNKQVDPTTLSRNRKIDGFIVIIDGSNHTMCRVIAASK